MGRAGVIPFGYFTGTSPPRAWAEYALFGESLGVSHEAIAFLLGPLAFRIAI